MINWAHVHILINYIPVIGMLGAVLLLIYAVIRKSDKMRTISFSLFVLIAAITIAVYATGVSVDRAVKSGPGITDAVIGQHEEMGQFSMVLTVTLGIAALVGLVIRRRTGSIPACTLTVVLLMSIITSIVIGITANLGNQIRHTEARVAASSQVVP